MAQKQTNPAKEELAKLVDQSPPKMDHQEVCISGEHVPVTTAEYNWETFLRITTLQLAAKIVKQVEVTGDTIRKGPPWVEGCALLVKLNRLEHRASELMSCWVYGTDYGNIEADVINMAREIESEGACVIHMQDIAELVQRGTLLRSNRLVNNVPVQRWKLGYFGPEFYHQACDWALKDNWHATWRWDSLSCFSFATALKIDCVSAAAMGRGTTNLNYLLEKKESSFI